MSERGDGRQKVVLLGESLLMDTVEASLVEHRQLNLIRVETNTPDLEAQLRELEPDLVIFDLNSPPVRSMIPILRAQSGIPLLGLDVTSSQVIAVRSHHHDAHSVDDLAQVIQQHALGRPQRGAGAGARVPEEAAPAGAALVAGEA